MREGQKRGDGRVTHEIYDIWPQRYFPNAMLYTVKQFAIFLTAFATGKSSLKMSFYAQKLISAIF